MWCVASAKASNSSNQTLHFPPVNPFSFFIFFFGFPFDFYCFDFFFRFLFFRFFSFDFFWYGPIFFVVWVQDLEYVARCSSDFAASSRSLQVSECVCVCVCACMCQYAGAQPPPHMHAAVC